MGDHSPTLSLHARLSLKWANHAYLARAYAMHWRAREYLVQMTPPVSACEPHHLAICRPLNVAKLLNGSFLPRFGVVCLEVKSLHLLTDRQCNIAKGCRLYKLLCHRP